MKRKLKLIFLAMVSTMTLTGCGSLSPFEDTAFSDKSESHGRFVTVDVVQDVYDGNMYIIKDEDTGMNYIYVRASNIAALSPLYDDNGEVMVSKED